MAKIDDPIQFHNCLYNVLEYVSDRDSGRMMRNLSAYTAEKTLDDSFWGHIYNIGGGESCRVSTRQMYEMMYSEMGFTTLDTLINPKDYATRNFHGHYYEDSDKLEEFLHFRKDSMQWYVDAFLEQVGPALGFAKVVNKLPGGQKLMGAIIQSTFKKNLNAEHGPRYWIKHHQKDHIEAYWGSKKAWKKLPKKFSDMEEFTDWDTVIHLDHGYDESKPESELTLKDMKGAAEFRGGKCLSKKMTTGDWTTPLEFQCAFGHKFHASPRLVLEGGHWCDECERKSWNYGQRAKVDPFFAQVWTPLHEPDELREYPKEVSERDV